MRSCPCTWHRSVERVAAPSTAVFCPSSSPRAFAALEQASRLRNRSLWSRTPKSRTNFWIRWRAPARSKRSQAVAPELEPSRPPACSPLPFWRTGVFGAVNRPPSRESTLEDCLRTSLIEVSMLMRRCLVLKVDFFEFLKRYLKRKVLLFEIIVYCI